MSVSVRCGVKSVIVLLITEDILGAGVSSSLAGTNMNRARLLASFAAAIIILLVHGTKQTNAHALKGGILNSAVLGTEDKNTEKKCSHQKSLSGTVLSSRCGCIADDH